MTPKFGGGGPNKPSMPNKDKAPVSDVEKGLKRKEADRSKVPTGRKDDKDKPWLGDVPDEGLEEALAEVESTLATNPADKEAHTRKFKILRKMHDRPAMRASLQAAARHCEDPYFGVKLAEALEEEGAYAKALEWRRWVAQYEPDDSDTIRRLAATAVRAGNLQTAEQSYLHLIELRKNDEAPLGGTFYEEMLGKGLDPAERTQLQHMALRLLSKALNHQERSATLLEAAARLAYRVRDMRACCHYFERAVESNPDHRNCRQWKLELLRAYGNAGLQRPWYDLSQSFMQELKMYLEEYRGDSRAWTMLAQLQIQAGYFEDAIYTLKSALETDSKNAQALWELGRLYVRMGRSQDAIDYYEEIISDPNEKKSVRRAIERTLAELYFRTGKYHEALELYNRDPEANLRMMAPVYEALGDLEAAEDHYNRSVRQGPRDARTHLGVAEYWVRRENWAKAAEAGKEGLRCTYATEDVHAGLGVALATAQWKLGHPEVALSTMEEICQAYPDSIHQLFRKVKLLKLVNRAEEAMAIAREVKISAQHQTGCAPASSSLWSLLGDTNMFLSDLDGAKAAYTNALKYDYMDAVALRGLGLVAEKQGDLREAVVNLERFAMNDPLNLATPAVRALIQKLREKLPPEELPPPPPVEPEPAIPSYSGPPVAQHAPQPVAQPAQPQQNQGWLGGNDSMDWFDNQ